jgi:hypothetical protein
MIKLTGVNKQDVTTARAPARIDSSSNERPSVTAVAPEHQQNAADCHIVEEASNNNISRNRTFRSEQYLFDSKSANATMEECETYVISQLDTMRASHEHIITFDMLVRTIANFSLDLIDEGTSKIVAERGMDNNAAEEIPPVLPLELCALSHRDFVMLLEKQNTCLRHTTASQEIEIIDEQFRNLTLGAYREDAGIKNSLDALRGVQSMKASEGG